jgi:hypothetical protein
MIRCAIAIAGLSTASASAAAPDLARQPVGMASTGGRCTSLVMGGRDTPCGNVIISLRYSDGQRSLAVKAGDGLVSFFGRPDKDGIELNLVTGVRPGASDNVSVASIPVTGRCTPAAIAAKAEINCTATARDGSRYAMTFVTDDKPPADSDFTR